MSRLQDDSGPVPEAVQETMFRLHDAGTLQVKTIQMAFPKLGNYKGTRDMLTIGLGEVEKRPAASSMSAKLDRWWSSAWVLGLFPIKHKERWPWRHLTAESFLRHLAAEEVPSSDADASTLKEALKIMLALSCDHPLTLLSGFLDHPLTSL